ncbi:uncharacterized protein BX664DRAFT_385224 [Halteromyces radiatus]|uniref:uncharacterized protein n=1 Tax=Halteromyces radiatus TaxID=101107 RepID=UPI0022203009|nr:uncharacterized protein BX664DRAFT_385224 [Halteromyces radiatus]KAI8093882.1 hypothetical protein BX664DRAFT_385224 [Halteromyces radiatus]
MKKLFGSKKKKKTKAASFISADSDYQVNDIVPRKLKISQSTGQPRKLALNDVTNNDNNNNKVLVKTTIQTQPAVAKRVNRPTSSPPALVMPRPRYAEPPTRAVLRSYDHEKTQLDPDLLCLSTENDQPDISDEEDELFTTVAVPSQRRQGQRMFPTATSSAPVPTKPRKTSPVTTQHDTRPSNRSQKSVDGAMEVIIAKKHESMNSITGSDDSNRVYESALESPMASTSTILENNGISNGLRQQQQIQRHSSPENINKTLIPTLLPQTASDSSETVTPAGSTSQHQRNLGPEVIVNSVSSFDVSKSTPSNVIIPLSDSVTTTTQHHSSISPQNMYDTDSMTQEILQSDDLELLQQQVKLIQQQREMDRAEYERLEQIHKERTKWMKAEIDRTQTRLLQLTAAKRDYGTSYNNHDANASSQEAHHLPSIDQQHATEQQPTSAHVDLSSGVEEQQDITDPLYHQQQQQQQQQQQERHPSSCNSTPSKLQRSKSGNDNLSRLSRSSSKNSTGDSMHSQRSRGIMDERQQQSKQQAYQQPSTMHASDTTTMDYLPTEQSGYMNGRKSSASLSRQSSGRRSQQSQKQQQQQQQQDSSQMQGKSNTSRSRPRLQRPRSKSTESRPPHLMEPEADYYTEYYDDRPAPPRPRSSNRPRHRSHSVERSYPSYYDSPYYYYDDHMMGNEDEDNDEVNDEDEDDEEGDAFDDDYMATNYRYPPPFRYDSFPPRPRRIRRQPMSHSPYIQPMPFAPTYPPPMRYNNHPPPHHHRSRPSRREQGTFYGFDNPAPSYYPPMPPPSLRRRQQQQVHPGLLPMDDWQSTSLPSSFSRYPPSIPPFIRMEDPSRRPGTSYWRARPPSEYAM